MLTKKWDSGLVTIALVTLMFPQYSFASTFTDVSTGIWYAPDLKIAEERGWVSGYKDDNGNDLHRFGPQDLVTMGQALKITQIAAGRFYGNKPCAGCHWAEPYQAEGAADYIALNTESLDRGITRAEAAALIGNAFHLELPHTAWVKTGERTEAGVRNAACTDPSYLLTDLLPTSRFCSIINHLFSLNVLQGEDSLPGQPRHFRPDDQVSRAEFVRMAVNGWATFSAESPYASVGDMKIEDNGIQVDTLYTTYEGGKFTVTNHSSHVATVSFSPALFKSGAPGDWNPTDGQLAAWGRGPDGPLSTLTIQPGWQTHISLSNDATPGRYSFIVEANGQRSTGEMVVQPDPLQRGW